MLDVWMLVCVVFIFLVLIEFAIVPSLIRRQEKAAATRIENMGTIILPIMFACFNIIYWFTLFFT